MSGEITVIFMSDIHLWGFVCAFLTRLKFYGALRSFGEGIPIFFLQKFGKQAVVRGKYGPQYTVWSKSNTMKLSVCEFSLLIQFIQSWKQREFVYLAIKKKKAVKEDLCLLSDDISFLEICPTSYIGLHHLLSWGGYDFPVSWFPYYSRMSVPEFLFFCICAR